MSASSAGECTTSSQALARDHEGRRNLETLDAVEQSEQLVAIEARDEPRRIEQRPRPVRQCGIDRRKRVAAVFGVGSDHDRDVVVGQRGRQLGLGDHIQHHQLDAGFLQQEFDRHVAADVGGGCECEHAQPRLLRRARRPEQPMRQQHLVLDRKARLLVAEQLRNQRSVDALARIRGTVQQLCDQLRPFGTKIVAVEGQFGKFRHADTVSAFGARRIGRLQRPRFHVTAPSSPPRRRGRATVRSSQRFPRCNRVRDARSVRR